MDPVIEAAGPSLRSAGAMHAEAREMLLARGWLVLRVFLWGGLYGLPALLALVGLVLGAPLLGEGAMESAAFLALAVVVVVLIAVTWFFYVYAAAQAGAFRALAGPAEGNDARAWFRSGTPYAIPLLWLGGLVGLGLLVGFALLIVPGVVLMVWWSVAGYVLVLEGVHGVAALRRSKWLVHGRTGAVFWRLLTLFFVTMLLSAPSMILEGITEGGGSALTIAFGVVLQVATNCLTTVYSVIFLYVLYRELYDGPRAADARDP
ncbi:MAG: hypothetical protein K8I02_09140 [Candidatus Methylomirabilis sp.]|nr:hypothetical protein [Deltaproteobacteria bacterium]